MKLYMFVVFLVFLVVDMLSLVSADSNTPNCGSRFLVGPPGTSRIVGGQEALLGSWPWQVSIQYSNAHICGGTIVHPLWVLTASHCFNKDLKARDYIVVAGLTTLSRPKPYAQGRQVSKIKKHKYYNKLTSENDIALLRLNSPWVFNDFVQPICTPQNKSQEVTLDFNHCFISGWGSTYHDGPGVDKLQEAEVGMIDRLICNQVYWYNGIITTNMLCAGLEWGGVDSCQGDSGGPLQCYSETQERFYQLGITSFGDQCGLPFRPGVYARTSRYAKWIEATQNDARGSNSSSNQLFVILSVGLLLLQIAHQN